MGRPTASQHSISDSETLSQLVSCAPDADGVRTSGLPISSPTLYPLSHPVTCVCFVDKYVYSLPMSFHNYADELKKYNAVQVLFVYLYVRRNDVSIINDIFVCVAGVDSFYNSYVLARTASTVDVTNVCNLETPLRVDKYNVLLDSGNTR